MAAPLILPRPGAPLPTSPQPPIPAPKESDFTSTFGALLPPATYLSTPHGRAAYYSLPPLSPAPTTPPTRILLIHGIQTPALGLYPLASALRKSRPNAHLVLLDNWGHGLTDTPVAAHTSALFHTLIDALLDELNWEKAHFVGYSLGGMLVAGYLAARAARAQSFVLVAPAGLLRSKSLDARDATLLRGEDGENYAAVQEWVVRALEGGELVVPADWEARVARGEVVAEALREWQMRCHKGHAASVVSIFRDAGVWDNEGVFRGALETGVQGCVVLGGEDDVCTAEEVRGLGFEVDVVEGVGHGVVRERAGEVARLVGEFWGKLSV